MPTKHYWWLSGVNDGERFLIFGSDISEDDARRRGLELLRGIDFEVRKLNTKNLASASQKYKGHRLERTRDLRTATRRLRHKGIKKQNNTGWW
ncbi:MAG: hypothetical protein KKD77_21680 [Gammaproteobacteria bacterium]|nr:hypothetical protein [Gammaproteobacteria bacterium]